MSSLKMWKGKAVYKWYSAMDINGNKVAKIFYVDGTTEIVRSPLLPWSSDKFYKSLSGLYASK
ncbi:MAG: hypothetical protein [Bacteriophage sp.]|jgi:hypothetical protein|nr:MAG: hypothetical protein [Bacteriophage sp.]